MSSILSGNSEVDASEFLENLAEMFRYYIVLTKKKCRYPFDTSGLIDDDVSDHSPIFT